MKRAFTLIELLIVIAIIAILALIAIPNFIEAQMRAKVSRVHADMRTVATGIEAYFVDHNCYPRTTYALGLDHGSESFGDFMVFKGGNVGPGRGAIGLTTPVSYLTSIPLDPFHPMHPVSQINYGFFLYNFLDADRHVTLWESEFVAANTWSAAGIDELTAPAPMRFNCGRGATWDTPGANWEVAPIYWSNWALLSYGPDRNYTVDVDGTGAGRMCVYCFLNNQGHWSHMKVGLATVYDPTNGTVSRGFIWRTSSKNFN